MLAYEKGETENPFPFCFIVRPNLIADIKQGKGEGVSILATPELYVILRVSVQRKILTYELCASFSFFSNSASGICSKTLNKPAEPGAMSRILPLGSMTTKVGNAFTS